MVNIPVCVIEQCCNFHGINSTVDIARYIFRIRASAGRIRHLENMKSYMSYLQQYTKIIKIPTLNTYFSYILWKLKRRDSFSWVDMYFSRKKHTVEDTTLPPPYTAKVEDGHYPVYLNDNNERKYEPKWLRCIWKEI